MIQHGTSKFTFADTMTLNLLAAQGRAIQMEGYGAQLEPLIDTGEHFCRHPK